MDKAIKERPILFSAPMVNAILEGRKTQTRRVVKEPSHQYLNNANGSHTVLDGCIYNYSCEQELGDCPYGQPGDQLWVRETFRQAYPETSYSEGIVYRADKAKSMGMDEYSDRHKWKPSIFMPRNASRIQLEITNIRVERLNDISEDDAKAEGITILPLQDDSDPSAWYQSAPGTHQSPTARRAFCKLWKSINGAGSWDENPWVWCVTFKRVTTNG